MHRELGELRTKVVDLEAELEQGKIALEQERLVSDEKDRLLEQERLVNEEKNKQLEALMKELEALRK